MSVYILHDGYLKVMMGKFKHVSSDAHAANGLGYTSPLKEVVGFLPQVAALLTLAISPTTALVFRTPVKGSLGRRFDGSGMNPPTRGKATHLATRGSLILYSTGARYISSRPHRRPRSSRAVPF